MASLTTHLLHWFVPHHSNNYRARLLHNSTLLLTVGLVIGLNVFLRVIESSPLHILGFNSSVTIDEVVAATNRERLAAGLKPLVYSEILADAARRKAANMYAENYWAHNSPSGKTPWVWFNQVGYKYLFAGENLAKDFGDTSRLMTAWMNSPTHRANIVNDKYQEIGVAVVPGSLLGGETVLVVQLFGTKAAAATVSAPTNPRASPVIAVVQGDQSVATPAMTSAPVPVEIMQAGNKIDKVTIKKTLAMTLATLFLIALVLDLVIAENQVLSRRVGKNWGHIIVINVILLLVVFAHAGNIL